MARRLHDELSQLGDGERIVVAHSCGVALWLLAAAELSPDERVDRVALVAPPGLAAFVPACRAFLPVGLDQDAVIASSRCSSNCRLERQRPQQSGRSRFLRSIYTDALGLANHVIPGAGHVTAADGYGPRRAMLEWCQGDPRGFGEAVP
jgi:pimeloyl-ACP methyl ester carboxylesterase